MAAYQGYRSWNAWNVALWIFNDGATYNYGHDLCRKHGKAKAARIFAREMYDQRTPDGAKYTLASIREAFAGMN
jgi:hypothetical protein